jgi:glycerol-3-phosphate dehydrogenase
MLHAGIIMYDLIAPKWNHQRLSAEEIRGHFPAIRTDGLIKGFRYQDAALDDARLVLREIREGIRSAGTALNYAKAERLLTTADGSVHGVVVSDQSGEGFPSAEVQAKAVVQATGPWSDVLRNQIGAPPRMRKQRGSHLVFPRERFPAPEAITLFHPQDRRSMFIIPWEGVTIVGTTDIDHEHQLEEKYDEPFASRAEIDYMLDALAFLFPELALSEEDITSTFSGLRPIITSGAENPSKESRAHQIWNEKGLITITGGKLTTYQKMAVQTLETAAAAAGLGLNENSLKPTGSPDYLVHNRDLDPQDYAYLCGRYGPDLNSLIQVMKNNDREHIEGLPNLWAEVRWAVRSDNIHHLDDLLLRRVRLGVLLPQGGRSALPRVREIVKEELGWDEKKWLKEKKAYMRTWQKYYSPDPG